MHLNLHKANEQVLNLAKKLSKNYKIILLSNNFQNYIDYLNKKFKYDKIFDEVINSQKIKIIKTNPKMFKYVLDKYKVKGEEVIFIDDIEKYLKVAAKYNIKGIQYKNYNQFKKELSNYLKPKIKLVIFDCYGLILSSGYPDTSKALVKKYGGSYKKYQDIMYFKYFNQAAERKITQTEAWQKTVDDCNLPITWQQLRDLHYSFFKLNKKTIELNKELNKKGYKTLLLSKNTRSQFSFAVKKFGFKKHFKNIINTYELGLPKASKATLNEVVKRLKVKPQEIVYADDQRNNLVDAKKMGIKTIFVKNFNQFKKDLYKYL